MSNAAGGGVNATTLAAMIGVSKGRISQLLAEGKLEGSYSGQGRARRFDPQMVAKLLDLRLHPGQALGNGAVSAASRRDVLAGEVKADPRPTASAVPPASEDADAARYQRARADQAEVDAILKRRRLAEESGRWVLASEVERATRSAISAEIAQFESMLRDAARRVADELGVDYRSVKVTLMEEWRRHRARRRDRLVEMAGAAELSENEVAEDFGDQMDGQD